MGLLLFIVYVNDLPLNMNTDSKLVLFADDTSVLTTANNLNDLQIKSTTMLNQMNVCFIVNGQSLNIEKNKCNTFQITSSSR